MRESTGRTATGKVGIGQNHEGVAYQSHVRGTGPVFRATKNLPFEGATIKFGGQRPGCWQVRLILGPSDGTRERLDWAFSPVEIGDLLA